MHLWRGFAAAGLGALAVAVLSLVGAFMGVEPARTMARELVTVAYLAFFVGVVTLLGAAVVRGLSQVVYVLESARRAE